MSHHARAPWSGHEADHVDIRGVLKFTLFVFVLIGVAGVITGAELYFYKVRRPDRQPPHTYDQAAVPDRVNEWQHPGTDLVHFRAQQQENLTTYGWADPGHTARRIPIDRAMQLLAAEQSQPSPEKKP